MKKVIILLVLIISFFLLFLAFLKNNNGKEYQFSNVNQFKQSAAFSWYIDEIPDDSHDIYLKTNVDSNDFILIFSSKNKMEMKSINIKTQKDPFSRIEVPSNFYPSIKNLLDESEIFCIKNNDSVYFIKFTNYNDGYKYILINSYYTTCDLYE